MTDPATSPATHPAADPAPLEPPRPEDYECCGNGCEPCIFDLHAQAVDRWRAEMKAWRERQAARPSAGPSAELRAELPARVSTEVPAQVPAVEAGAPVPALCRPDPPR